MTIDLLYSADDIQSEKSLAATYVANLIEETPSSFVTNTNSIPFLIKAGGHDLPATVDAEAYGYSYASSPHSAYVLYAREELNLVGLKHGKSALLFGISILDKILRAIKINKVVHIDNWLLSTNLHDKWRGEGIGDIRSSLIGKYKDHFLITRSVDDWASPDLMKALKKDGWQLLPSRQVWVTDDVAASWKPSSSTKNDQRLLRKSGLTIETLDEVSPTDADRIAQLYHMLYVGKYSPLNPVLSPNFISMTNQIGMLKYVVARDDAGTIMAVAGMWVRDQIMTPTVVGYDTTRPQEEGLYRIAAYLFSQWALEKDLKLHGSAGAGVFKKRRGAISKVEYMAVYCKHLPPHKRVAIGILAKLLNSIGVPLLEKNEW